MDKTAEDINALNETFSRNDMLARALLQLLPQEERPHISMWLEKLQTIDGDKKCLKTRNDYTWLLLVAMQKGKLTEPFDQLPPTKDLLPLSDILPPHVFHETFISAGPDVSCIDTLFPETNDTFDESAVFLKSVPPHKFFGHQPKPLHGIACYFSIFSNDSSNA